MAKKEEKGFAFLAPLVVIVVLSILAIAGFFAFQKSKDFLNWQNNDQTPNQQACTQEAKICPDGSSVGRTGPNCEFAKCPQVNNQEFQTHSNTEYGFEFKYPLKLDSKFFTLSEKENIIVSSKTDIKIKDECYIGGANPAVMRKKIKANDINICFSQSYDPGAGSGVNYYFYTFLKDNNYITIEYNIRQPNSCGPYFDTENYEPCQKEFQNYQTIVDKPINESIMTLKFIN